jgi:hypothetical protein
MKDDCPMSAIEIAPGLWRWTAAHPEWKPGAQAGSSSDWAQDVGSVLYEVGETVVLFDPLVPAEGREGFLDGLDERIAGRPVSILTTIRWHRRDRELLAERYRANSSRAWNAVPPGVVLKAVRGGGEMIYWLPGVAALVFGDTLIGSGPGEVRVCPESWLSDVQVDRAGLAGRMRPLLELPVELLLISHGEPLLHDGRAALARALHEADAEVK